MITALLKPIIMFSMMIIAGVFVLRKKKTDNKDNENNAERYPFANFFESHGYNAPRFSLQFLPPSLLNAQEERVARL